MRMSKRLRVQVSGLLILITTLPLLGQVPKENFAGLQKRAQIENETIQRLDQIRKTARESKDMDRIGMAAEVKAIIDRNSSVALKSKGMVTLGILHEAARPYLSAVKNELISPNPALFDETKIASSKCAACNDSRIEYRSAAAFAMIGIEGLSSQLHLFGSPDIEVRVAFGNAILKLLSDKLKSSELAEMSKEDQNAIRECYSALLVSDKVDSKVKIEWLQGIIFAYNYGLINRESVYTIMSTFTSIPAPSKRLQAVIAEFTEEVRRLSVK